MFWHSVYRQQTLHKIPSMCELQELKHNDRKHSVLTAVINAINTRIFFKFLFDVKFILLYGLRYSEQRMARAPEVPREERSQRTVDCRQYGGPHHYVTRTHFFCCWSVAIL